MGDRKTKFGSRQAWTEAVLMYLARLTLFPQDTASRVMLDDVMQSIPEDAAREHLEACGDTILRVKMMERLGFAATTIAAALDPDSGVRVELDDCKSDPKGEN